MNLLRHRFRQDQGGATAILFGLALIPILGILAGAIDFGRAYSAKTSMQGALDAALLAAASKRAQFVKHTYLSR